MHSMHSNKVEVGCGVGQLRKDFSCPRCHASQVLGDGTSRLCEMGQESFGGLLWPLQKLPKCENSHICSNCFGSSKAIHMSAVCSQPTKTCGKAREHFLGGRKALKWSTSAVAVDNKTAAARQRICCTTAARTSNILMWEAPFCHEWVLHSVPCCSCCLLH